MRFVNLLHFFPQTLEQFLLLESIADNDAQVIVVPGFFDVVKKADLVDPLDGVLLVGVPGQDDSRNLG